jgi:hypothetical protein
VARNPQYLQGFREASKIAITLAGKEADRMNDPHARQVLNAFQATLGTELKRQYRARKGPEKPDEDESV